MSPLAAIRRRRAVVAERADAMNRPLTGDRDLALRLQAIAADRRRALAGLALLSAATAFGLCLVALDVASVALLSGMRSAKGNLVAALGLALQSAIVAVVASRTPWRDATRRAGRRHAWAEMAITMVSRAIVAADHGRLADHALVERIERDLARLDRRPQDPAARLAMMETCVRGAAVASPAVRPWLLAHVSLMASAMGAKPNRGRKP